MNDKQKRISKSFLFLVCSLLLVITGVISFAVYQHQIAQQGDIFDKVVAEQNMAWISPSLVFLSGMVVIAIILFVGLWKINKASQNCQNQTK